MDDGQRGGRDRECEPREPARRTTGFCQTKRRGRDWLRRARACWRSVRTLKPVRAPVFEVYPSFPALSSESGSVRLGRAPETRVSFSVHKRPCESRSSGNRLGSTLQPTLELLWVRGKGARGRLVLGSAPPGAWGGATRLSGAGSAMANVDETMFGRTLAPGVSSTPAKAPQTARRRASVGIVPGSDRRTLPSSPLHR